MAPWVNAVKDIDRHNVARWGNSNPRSASASLSRTQQNAACKAQMMCLSLHPDVKRLGNWYFPLENEAEP